MARLCSARGGVCAASGGGPIGMARLCSAMSGVCAAFGGGLILTARPREELGFSIARLAEVSESREPGPDPLRTREH
jgi:hypothetical protein